MGGQTGYPDIGDTSIPFGGPEYFDKINKHWDDIIARSVETPNQLPIAGDIGWGGRLGWVHGQQRMYVQVEAGGDYTFLAPATWAARITVAATGTTTVNFPSGFFTRSPQVQVTTITTSGPVAVPWVGATPTTSSMVVRLFTLSGAQVGGTVDIVATQATP